MITREMIEENLREIIFNRRELSADRIPEGWISVKDASKIIGLSEGRTREHLSVSGVEKKPFRILCGKKVLPVPHYFLGKKPK